ESSGLDRDLEFLPTDAEIEQRLAEGRGLVSPEIAILTAYTKAHLADQILASDLPDAPAFRAQLPNYFPTPMRKRFANAIDSHSLGREIITTMVVNDMVNVAGIHYAFRLAEDVNASASDAVRAYTIV